MSSGVLGFVLGMSCFGIAIKLTEYKNSPSLPPMLAGIPVSILKEELDNRLSSYYVKKKEVNCFHSVCTCIVKLNVLYIYCILHFSPLKC